MLVRIGTDAIIVLPSWVTSGLKCSIQDINPKFVNPNEFHGVEHPDSEYSEETKPGLQVSLMIIIIMF